MRTPVLLLAKTALAAGSIVLLTGAVVVSCSGDPAGSGGDPDNRPDSAAMGDWSETFTGACTEALHDGYFVIGPDGRKYPSWHPATDRAADGSTCFYGHEHGEDPSGSILWNDLRRHFAWDANGNGAIEESEWNNARSGVPFGYVSQYATAAAGTGPHRHDHRSYKIHYADAVTRQRLVNGQPQDFDLACDHFAAYSQDSWSARALVSNLHALTWAVDCNRGTAAATYAPKLIVSVLAPFGAVDAIVGEDGGAELQTTGVATVEPAERRAPLAARGAEQAPRRLLPATLVASGGTDRVHRLAFVPFGSSSDLVGALEERWDALVAVTRDNGAELARFNPGLVLRDPARWYGGSAAPLQRSIDLCYTGLNAAGVLVSDPAQVGSIVRQVRGNTACALLSPTGPGTAVASRIAFSDAAARFKGCARQLVLRDQSIANGAGPTTWYTDPFGANARSTFSTATPIRQFIAAVNTGSSIVLAPQTVDENVTAGCNEASGVRVPAQ